MTRWALLAVALGAAALLAMATACGDRLSAGTPPGGGSCSQTLCSGACVDTKSDPQNCGGCGQACAPGVSCVNGSCSCSGICGGVCCTGKCIGGRCEVQLYRGPEPGQIPVGIAVDATCVYWTNANGEVMKVLRDGGAPVTLGFGPSFGQSTPWDGIALDATSVYWTNPSAYAAMKMPLDGGTPVKLAAGSRGLGIAVDATDAFFTDPPTTVLTTPLASSQLAMLIGGRPFAPCDIAVDTSSVYWTEHTGNHGDVMKMPLDSSTPVTLASSPAERIALDATSVYWTTHLSGSIVMTVPRQGGAPVALVSGQPQSSTNNIAVDASSVYWNTYVDPQSSPTDAAVMKVPLAGGTPVTLVSNDYDTIGGIAVDATSVYWTDELQRTVMKLTPK